MIKRDKNFIFRQIGEQNQNIINPTMVKYFREKGWLKEKDENLTGDDIQEGL